MSTSTPDMADKPDLKQLANDLISAIEQAEHKPGQWAQTGQSMGGICCPGEPFDISKPWAKEEPWAHFSFKRDSWLAVAAVNALPKLLVLIAENEALKGPHDWLAEDLIKELVDNAQSFQENSCEEGEDPFVIVLLAAASRIRRQEANLDQLKAENEALRKALKEIANEIDGNTRPLIRDLVIRASGLSNGAHPNDLYGDCDRIDAIIVAAVAQGEQS